MRLLLSKQTHVQGVPVFGALGFKCAPGDVLRTTVQKHMPIVIARDIEKQREKERKERVCVCVCVRKRERKRVRKKNRERL